MLNCRIFFLPNNGINMIRRIALFLGFLPLLLLADEGMYPLSEIHKLDLQKAGLHITATDIFNENGISLVDAIVQIGGCTGSFVSPQGLILTNHHCAYGAAQRASSTEHDYIQNGFLAADQSREIEAKGYTVRITESYRDVSAEILKGISDKTGPVERTEIIEKNSKQLVKQTEAENPGKRAEVAEMFIGKTYVLFIYTYIRDVRMVYVPPRSIGEFGGDEDNWEWPRHNADFSFLRAYMAPDGSPADYSPDNVPFQPKNFLQIDPAGASEGDLVFILGYPGRTFRHRSAAFLRFEETSRMPLVVEWYQRYMELMRTNSSLSRDVAIRHLNRIKGLANTEKNYRGKLQGMKRLGLTAKRQAEEQDLQNFVLADKSLDKSYGTVLADLNQHFNDQAASFEAEFLLGQLRSAAILPAIARSLIKAGVERVKTDLERESAYMDRNYDRTKHGLLMNLNNFYAPTDQAILTMILQRLAELPASELLNPVQDWIRDNGGSSRLPTAVEELYTKTQLTDPVEIDRLLSLAETGQLPATDPMILFFSGLNDSYKALDDLSDRRKGEINRLAGKLTEMRRLYLQKDFIPDANGTFRLTYGYVRGYQPRDAVYKKPFTTLSGVIEKTTGTEPFDTPQALIELYKKSKSRRFFNQNLNDIPTAMLYTTDTTGGNSGSPVLNADGRLVGLNFDRTFEATINDFAWSESYSRSIGADIRYILWITGEFAGASHLLREMNL